jgi:hypothetical protein
LPFEMTLAISLVFFPQQKGHSLSMIPPFKVLSFFACFV